MGRYSDLLAAQNRAKQPKQPGTDAPESVVQIERDHSTPPADDQHQSQVSHQPAPEPPPHPQEATPPTPLPQPAQQSPNSTRTGRTGSTGRTPVRRRIMVRHPFEVYQDQVDQLRDLALDDRRNGGLGSMSQMVREGIDWIIAKRKREEEGEG